MIIANRNLKAGEKEAADVKYIDLNTDYGESFGTWRLLDDFDLLRYVSSANIACGLHAGDPVIMDQTVAACVERGVSIGAHPGFPDLQGFGRRDLMMSTQEIEDFVLYQIGALRAFAQSHGSQLSHVKPHGALYNMAARDEKIALAVARGIARAGKNLILVGLAGSASLAAATKLGIPWASEAFCDRAYSDQGSLVPRNVPGSVITDVNEVSKRAVMMAREGRVMSISGNMIDVDADTLCIHSDTPGATQIAKAVNNALTEAGVTVTGMKEVIGLE